MASKTPPFLVTGKSTLVLDLAEHDIAHLQPHQVDGRTVGRREIDVEVDRVTFVDRAHVALWWHGCTALPGGRPNVAGCEIYTPFDHVTVIGHNRAQEDVEPQRRFATAASNLALIGGLVAEMQHAARACAAVRAW